MTWNTLFQLQESSKLLTLTMKSGGVRGVVGFIDLWNHKIISTIKFAQVLLFVRGGQGISTVREKGNM